MKKLRLLYLPIEDVEGGQRARRKIFADMVQEGRLQALEIFSYVIYGRENGWKLMCQKIYELARDFQADAIYWQGVWYDGPLDEDILAKIKSLPSKPAICNENGDPFGNFWVVPYPKSLLSLNKFTDVCFNAGLGRAAEYFKKKGAKHVYLLPHGYDNVSFGDAIPEKTNYKNDLVMIANQWKSRRPLASAPGAKTRPLLIEALQEEFGNRFALYGKGWDKFSCSRGPIDFFEQTNAYTSSRVAIGLPQFSDIDYYESNRPFNSIATGTPYVSGYSSKFDEILKDGLHCHYFKTPQEAVDKVKWLLSLPDQQRMEMGKKAAEYVRAHHTQRHRMEILITILEEVWSHKHLNTNFPEPITSFLAQ
ncbi:glycosyltransferase [Methylobacter sp. S3L5C]|uniref:glycosyltransferase family protein n=1 Tax=Methylobacter sp. S3L5C TaxID=2839024 RepID=UPI001FAD189E|nr:glycosyltransferase [Methylobacter sp. S3L5C]UOA08549.1 glycosyltransferase [Methylobacter sp. S3L5C]